MQVGGPVGTRDRPMPEPRVGEGPEEAAQVSPSPFDAPVRLLRADDAAAPPAGA